MLKQFLKGRGVVLALALNLVFLAACSGIAEQPDEQDNDIKGISARPEQARVPVPPPQPLAPPPDASSLTRFVVPAAKMRPNASYQSIGPQVDVELKPFEVPTTGAKQPGVDSKKRKVPFEIERSAPGSQLEAWTGTEIRFDSIKFDDNAANNGGYVFIPPDSHAAAGPNHVVAVTNTTLEFRQKDGTLDFQDSLKDFFTLDPPWVSPTTFTFDPKVLYDQYEERWVVITLDVTRISEGDSADTSRMFVAVSDDSNPNGDWFLLQFDSEDDTGNHWSDYPGFAVDEEAVYITTNLFRYPPAEGYGGVRLWVIPKGVGSGGLYDGGTSSVNEFDPYALAGGTTTTTQPTHMYGAAPASLGVFLVSSGLTGSTIEYVLVV